MSGNSVLPVWALQRTATYLEALERTETRGADPVELARRTGLSKGLARRCLRHLQQQTPRPRS
ncbi:helix-turn-helix domain-containing protein [Arthrobacter sp. Z1-9]